jgi:nitrilase
MEPIMSDTKSIDHLIVGIAQLAPIWLDRERTLAKILKYVQEAGEKECQLLTLGEALLPGYPFWIERSNGAVFNSPVQKEIHAHYLDQAVQIEAGHLDPLRDEAKQHEMAIMLGIIERPMDRGGHSVYASLVFIDSQGMIQSVHRKLMPTYEERLTWAQGDGHGLRTHRLEPFTVGGLNCWENWIPLARATLYGQGEDLHVAVWPGNVRNTQDLTRYIALEARSYVVSVSGLMRKANIPDTIPHRSKIAGEEEDTYADGGSCIAAPDGSWVVEPLVNEERLIIATLDHARVREERQNFDPAGHYARPDVFQLTVNRERQSMIKLLD